MKTIFIKLMTVTILFSVFSCTKDTEIFVPNNSNGKGGSMAKLTLVGDYLYAIDDKKLMTFSVVDNANPVSLGETYVESGIETIFPLNEYLFIGGETGMNIYNINTPNDPEYISGFDHSTSCDPVVANDSLAFVTLRGGNDCRIGNASNELKIVDVSNIYNPLLLKTKEMDEPYGLAVDSNKLFICHGEYGLSVHEFSANYWNEIEIEQIHRFDNIESYDVITNDKSLLVVGDNGFYQYDYRNINRIYLLSSIIVGQ